jgi:hypothetical protein
MKGGDADQAKYQPAFLNLKGFAGNKGRRESTWALKNKEDIDDFITALYTHEDSPWYQGFHSQHAKALHSFISIKKFEKNTKLAFEVWDTTKGEFPNLDSAQGASSDMGLDFRLSGFKFCGKELPGRGKFIPSEGEDLLAPPTVDRANQDKGQTNQMQIALAGTVGKRQS